MHTQRNTLSVHQKTSRLLQLMAFITSLYEDLTDMLKAFIMTKKAIPISI